jgi:hypothetical protein
MIAMDEDFNKTGWFKYLTLHSPYACGSFRNFSFGSSGGENASLQASSIRYSKGLSRIVDSCKSDVLYNQISDGHFQPNTATSYTILLQLLGT